MDIDEADDYCYHSDALTCARCCPHDAVDKNEPRTWECWHCGKVFEADDFVSEERD